MTPLLWLVIINFPDVYHLVFKPPTDSSVADRLIQESGGVEHNMHKGLKYYRLNSSAIEACYKQVCSKALDADQPDNDLVTQGN